MKLVPIFVFAGAALLSLFAATSRIQDSAHVISILGRPAGKGALHPAVLDPDRSAYTVILTSTVLPSFTGNAQLVWEGADSFDREVYLAGAVVKLDGRSRPVLKGDILSGLKPRDSIALWIRLHRKDSPPPNGDSEAAAPKSGRAACPDCLIQPDVSEAAEAKPTATAISSGKKGSGQKRPLALAFYDEQKNSLLLRVPFVFPGKEDSRHAD